LKKKNVDLYEPRDIYTLICISLTSYTTINEIIDYMHIYTPITCETSKKIKTLKTKLSRKQELSNYLNAT